MFNQKNTKPHEGEQLNRDYENREPATRVAREGGDVEPPVGHTGIGTGKADRSIETMEAKRGSR